MPIVDQEKVTGNILTPPPCQKKNKQKQKQKKNIVNKEILQWVDFHAPN